MGRRRLPTGNREQDVVNPLFRAAEDRVYAYLQRLATPESPVVDMRHEKTYYDFRKGPFTIDVKCDQYAHQTGRVAWEQYIFINRGEDSLDRVNGWGSDERLDYIAYVFPKGDEEAWPCLIVNRRKMAQQIQEAVGTPQERELKAFLKESGKRTATGYAANIEWLRAGGCIIWTTEV